MNKIKIIVDSTTDLTDEYYQEHDIEVIPLSVIYGEETYLDGKEIKVADMYKRADETGVLPKTSAISVGALTECFKKYIDEGYDIFFTGISSFMSSTIQNAHIASQEFPEGRIAIYDSQNLSTGIGLQVMKAVKLRDEGKTLKEIIAYLESIRGKVVAQFVIEKLDYLYKGGRCSALSFFFGKALSIKPMIRVKDGKMFVFKKVIGNTRKSLNNELSVFKEDLANIDLDKICITSSMAPESEKYLYDEVTKLVDPSKVMLTHAGCVISAHCGAGTIGILYILK